MYEGILCFQGEWRSYQQRVLDHFHEYKEDGNIHIVAAPGSGKTTLGIELLRKIDQKALILVPTITIREQWAQRIKEAFLCANVSEEMILSQDLRDMKLITIATYQALHSAMTRYAGRLEDQEDKEDQEDDTSLRSEDVDYHDFDLLQEITKQQITTLCLDECHHLRNEWWKSLESFKKTAALTHTIALTATPPYDATIAMWTRYISMCGEIDEEITVPELVKDGSLCPHQDYVRFNYPTKKEQEEIHRFYEKSALFTDMLMQDASFQEIICSHRCLHETMDYDLLLEKPAYLSSILIYLHAKGCAYPKQYQELLGFQKLEGMSPKWMEILLQGLLYEDTGSYRVQDDDIKALMKEMKARGLIEKRTVTMTTKANIKRMLVRSLGKCESIVDITFHEHEQMQEELRELILTDYIQKEYRKAIGREDMDVHALGVLPFFELLRRENEQRHQSLRFGTLCGSTVIIPASAKQRLLELCEDHDIVFDALGTLDMNAYVEVKVHGDRHFLTGAVTQLFEEGHIQVLIGTKSLLGEGWDSPCVNTLILASFVGSFMLSNQMRGRAIRTYPKHPDKTSHIWHLVCIEPNDKQMFWRLEDSEDFQTLQRRMEHFLGLHYELDTIESGLERLSAITMPLSKHSIQKTNTDMWKLSSDRTKLKERWDRSLAVYSKLEVVEETKVEQKITAVVLIDYLRRMLVLAICLGLMFLFTFPLITAAPVIFVYTVAFGGSILACMTLSLKKIYVFGSPLRRLEGMGKGIEKALRQLNLMNSINSRVESESTGGIYVIYLLSGSGHDKTVFAKCMYEFMTALDNQRYLLYLPHRKKKKDGYFAVPEIFAKRKEDADVFLACMKPYIGRYQLVYTRNAEGRKILLQGRKYALANKEDRVFGSKKVKGALE